MTRVMIVDDHPVFRRGLAVLLSASGFDVVGEAANGREAIATVAAIGPDVVLMDLGMPELGGIAATGHIVAEHPQVRVVMITMHDDDESVRSALSAGAIGYVVKDAPPEEIIAAVHAAELGASLLGSGLGRPQPAAHPLDRLAEFTGREREVAQLLAKGLSNRSIATRLGVSDKTIANYVANVRLKLGAADRYEAGALIRDRT